jgi:hypothetical protein
MQPCCNTSPSPFVPQGGTARGFLVSFRFLGRGLRASLGCCSVSWGEAYEWALGVARFFEESARRGFLVSFRFLGRGLRASLGCWSVFWGEAYEWVLGVARFFGERLTSEPWVLLGFLGRARGAGCSVGYGGGLGVFAWLTALGAAPRRMACLWLGEGFERGDKGPKKERVFVSSDTFHLVSQS